MSQINQLLGCFAGIILLLCSFILNFAASGLKRRRRRVEARGRKPTCKIQNSKFGRGERPNFEFRILRRRVSVGRRRRVASVAVVASKRGGGSLLAKFKIENLAAGSGKIWIFEFCGVGSQSVVVGRRRRGEARGRKPSCKIKNSKFVRGERPNFEF